MADSWFDAETGTGSGIWDVLKDIFKKPASVVGKMEEKANQNYVPVAEAARESMLAGVPQGISPDLLSSNTGRTLANWDLQQQEEAEKKEARSSSEKARAAAQEKMTNLYENPAPIADLDPSLFSFYGPDSEYLPMNLIYSEADASTRDGEKENQGFLFDPRASLEAMGYGSETMRGGEPDSKITEESQPEGNLADGLAGALSATLAGNAPSLLAQRGYVAGDKTPSDSSSESTESSAEETQETQPTPLSTETPQDQTYTSRPVTTEMDEVYEVLETHPELAAKYAEFADRDNYGYSRARASGNSDFWADMALADPRIMQRFKNSGVDVDDLENLSQNIYNYMYLDNVIDLVDYYDNVSGYLGDSDVSVADMVGLLMQDSDYNFDADFLRRYGLNPEDAIVQAIIRNAYAGGAREYDLNRITDRMKKAGYLTDDEELAWGNSSDAWWVDNDKNRANLPEYLSLRDTQYLDPQMGVYDTNAALSLADAMALADAGVLDANGEAPSRRVVVRSKNNQKNKQKAFDSTVSDASSAASSLGYY